MTTPARQALAEAAAAERAAVNQHLRRQHHHSSNSGTGPGDPAAIAELIDAVMEWADLTDAQRAEAVRGWLAGGYSLRAIARHYRVDTKTIRKWAPKPTDPPARTREDAADGGAA